MHTRAFLIRPSHNAKAGRRYILGWSSIHLYCCDLICDQNDKHMHPTL